MRIRKLAVIVVLFCFALPIVQAEENVRKVATWNMKWLGTNSGSQLDPVENVPEYAKYVGKTGATLFALQEIGATHSVEEEPKCYYLDLIVDELNEDITEDSKKWAYILDGVNKSQRLAFLYKQNLWSISDPCSIDAGPSFQYIRHPFVVTVTAKGDNAELTFTYIDIHLKAFKKDKEKRAKNIEDLAKWLQDHSNTLDADVLVAGDTNIYKGESDIDEPLEDIDYVVLHDQEKTAIYKNKLGQRFDRFFCSPDLKKEIDSAKNIVGSTTYIDVVKDNAPAKIKWFDKNLSDHFPVVLNIDVSEER